MRWASAPSERGSALGGTLGWRTVWLVEQQPTVDTSVPYPCYHRSEYGGKAPPARRVGGGCHSPERQL
jgi:hypothetical protein